MTEEVKEVILLLPLMNQNETGALYAALVRIASDKKLAPTEQRTINTLKERVFALYFQSGQQFNQEKENDNDTQG